MSVQEYIYSGKTVEAKEIKVQSRHTCSHIESSQKDILTNRTYRHVDQKVHPSDVTAGIAVAREVTSSGTLDNINNIVHSPTAPLP
jgi:hypothetical protein